MSDNVIYPFGEPEPVGECRQDIVDALAYFTERARRGELVSLVVVAVDSRDTVVHCTSTPENGTFALIGGLEFQKSKIIREVTENGLSPIADFD